MERIVLQAVILVSACSVSFGQSVDYIANNLGVRIEVVSNLVGGTDYFTSKVTLTNDGGESVTGTEWRLYFMSIYMLEPEQELWKTDDGYEIPKSGFKVYHIAGCLFKFEPVGSFAGIPAGGSITIDLVIQYWSVARTDNMPNWYVTDTSGNGNRTVRSTATENLIEFTGDYSTEAQWKRYEDDRYDPWSPQQRWDMNNIKDLGAATKLVIPTPFDTSTQQDNRPIAIPLAGWNVTFPEGLENIAALVQSHTGDPVSGEGEIHLEIDAMASSNKEGYKLVIDGNSNLITLTSPSDAGLYYGSQTLTSLLDSASTEIASMTITDEPRFGYRGMHVDVGRHFVPADDLKKLIQVMGRYKLNKLHLHLTDDEGWRIEMPWCPYLTSTGATQCHDESELSCQYPQFGSRPDGSDRGSGSYSAADYKEILKVASQNYIEVIPEVDLPGHARSAIKGVQAFLKSEPDNEEARAIQLTHENDTSQYLSVQMYTDNAVDPCLNSTYEFVRKAIDTFIEYHSEIQPLKVMHMGGDEVAEGAWEHSPACKEISSHGEVNTTRLAEEFVYRVSRIAKKLNASLSLGLWEDGAIKNEIVFDRDNIATKDVLVHSWQNIWEWGVASRAYKLANAGYKVIMSQATHLYFDHPPEPDPEERGSYWATRYSNIRKTFGFKPDDLYANIDVSRAGDPLDEDELCQTVDCTELDPEHAGNIIGMQGQIWTEARRTSEQFFDAVFPRLLALAERAWHKADWETSLDAAKEQEDWTDFANTLGYKELRRLDEMDVSYRVPVPGAKSADGGLIANVELPGLAITYATEDTPNKWHPYTNRVKSDGPVKFRSHSSDKSRTSRVISATYSGTSRIRIHPAIALLGFLVGLLLLKF